MESPHLIAAERTLQLTLQQMAVIHSQPTSHFEAYHYGVRGDENPILRVPGDVYK